MRAARREVGADDIVVQEAADLVPVLLEIGQQVLTAEESLFLSRDRGEHERGAVEPGGKEPRALDGHCGPRGVVVGSRRVGLRIHDAARHRVEVAGN